MEVKDRVEERRRVEVEAKGEERTGREGKGREVSSFVQKFWNEKRERNERRGEATTTMAERERASLEAGRATREERERSMKEERRKEVVEGEQATSKKKRETRTERKRDSNSDYSESELRLLSSRLLV